MRNESDMADFSLETSCRAAISASLQLGRKLVRLARQEYWAVYAVLARCIRKMEPFFDEALKSIGHNHMLQRQLAALQDLQAVLQRLSTALESRQGVSRVYKLILSQPLLEITTSCCLELKDALEAALDGDFQVPLDVVEDLHSVVLKLDDLEFEDAVRDINIVQGMQRQLQSLQITWDTAGFHDSLMKSLESVGVCTPVSSTAAVDELHRMQSDHQYCVDNQLPQEALLLRHVMGMYNIRKHEVCQEAPDTDQGRPSPCSVIDGPEEGWLDTSRSQSGRLQFSPDSLEHEEQSRRIRSSSIPPCRTRGALRRSPSFRLGENRDAEGFTTPPAKYVLESDSLLYSEQSIGVRARDRANQMRAEISRLRVRQRSICDASGLAVLNPLQFPGKHASSGLTDSLPLRKSPQNTRTCSTAGSNTLRDNNCTCGIYKSGGSRQQSAAGAIPSHAGSMCKSYFVCPLTKEVMEDPVLLADSGHTFERSAIEAWIADSNACCPVSGKPLRMKMLVPNLKVKQGIKDFRSATKSATGAETQGADTEMERIANWIEMMNSDLAVDQHIALSTLVQAELGDEAKAYFVAMDGIPALLRLLCYGDSSNLKGSVVRALWLHILNDETGRLEVVRANGLLRICELISSDLLRQEAALESALRCLKALAFTGPLRAQARNTGVLLTLVSWVAQKGKPLAIRQATAAAIAALVAGEKESRAEVVKAGGVRALVEQLGDFSSGGDRGLRLEALAALTELCYEHDAQAMIVSGGLLQDICRLIQLSKPSLKLAVAGVCRLLALNPAHAVQLAQVGIIPPLVQMVYNGPGQESGEVAAKALCNMSQHPLCRRIIARAGMNLLRQSSDSAALRTSRKANQGDIASTDIIPASEWHINIGPRYVQGDDPATIG